MSIQELNKSIIAKDTLLAESLIEKMDNVNPSRDTSFTHENYSHVSPLFLAAFYKNLSLVKRLVEKGADPNIHTIVHCCGLPSKNVLPLDEAIKSGDLEIVKYLHKKGAISVFSPLNFAAKHGHVDIVKYFHENGEDIDSKSKGDDYFPLHYACRYGNTDLFKYLVEHGADINQQVEGVTCLHMASEVGNVEIAKYLLDKGVAIEIDEEKYNYYQGSKFEYFLDNWVEFDPLHIASINGHFEMVKLLVERGANVNRATPPNGCEFGGCTPLRISIGNGDLNLFKYLLDKEAEYNSSDLELAEELYDKETSRDELFERRKVILQFLEGRKASNLLRKINKK